MFIVNHKTFFFWFSGVLMALALAAMAGFGFRYGIEFTGGSILEVEYPAGRPAVEGVRSTLDGLGLGTVQVQEIGERGYIIRTEKSPSEEERLRFIAVLSGDGTRAVEEVRYDSVGPTIGKELRQKAVSAIALVILAIVLYIAFAFRGVSRPISSWMYGLAAIIGLVHDVLVPAGFYVTLSHYHLDAEVDVLFIMAILTVLGFSVHDKIVVFDRTRENLKLGTWKEFPITVGHSISQTLTRSINTSLTVLLVTLALFFVGGETTKYFALTLAVGVVAGTYSSICFASPLLVAIEEWQRRKGEKARGR